MNPRHASSRLKSLELQGYKTFATKTLFEFAPTITAIVGPNGSGKSNIADAIRWVLGEQSYTLLRGKRTEDMIFSGSELRPRAGLASAQITFDNSDGWLPIEFGEVSVGRRASRDGQNDYLINGQRVRLRDVGEILAESGLAERTYTIIGQGLVDAALSLRADERRKLFEEAAGIGLYRKRREEAARRLENTRRNLERVQDILAELRPRLRSLERQAQRARDYDQVRDDLKASLRVWYGYHWEQAQTELGQIRSSAAQAEKTRQSLLDAQSKIEAQLAELRASLNGLRGEIGEAANRRTELLSQSQTLGRQEAVAGERLRWLEEQRDLIASELAGIEESLNRLLARLESVQGERESLRLALTVDVTAGADFEVGDPDADTAPELRRRLAQARAQESDLQTQKVRLETERQQLETRMVEVQERREVDRQTHADQKRQLAKLETLVAEKSEAVRSTEGDLEELRRELGGAEGEFRALESRRVELTGALQDLEIDLARKRAQLAATDERSDHDLAERARAVRPQALVGPSGVWLTYPARLERAIGAALGEFLQGTPFRTTEDILEVLQELDGQLPAGKAALLSLSGKASPRLEVPDERGVVGLAADLVAAKQGWSQLVEALLGRVVIVEDRQAAGRLLPDLAPDARIVTLAGEIYLGSGQVLVGSTAGQPPAEKPEALRQEVEEGQRTRQEISTQLQSIKGRLDDLRSRMADFRDRQMELEGRLEGQREAWRSASGDLAEAEGKARASAEQVERSRRELEELRSQSEDINPSLGGLRDRWSQAQQSARSLRAELDRLEAGSDQVEDQTRFDALQRTMEETTARMEEYQDRIDALEAERAGWLQRLSDNQAQEKELKAELNAVHSRMAELGQAVEREDNLLSPAEAEIREQEARRSELEGQESETRLALQRAEYENSQVQIKLARKEEELLGLQRRIEDDFGLVAFDYDDSVTGQELLPLEGLVEKLPAIDELPAGLESQVRRLRAQLRRMGAVNPEAQAEYEEVKERVEFLTGQVDDLRAAEAKVEEVIAELGVIMEREFRKTFDAVAVEFRETFQRLFGGGSARLHLAEDGDPNEAGIEIEARLPGKREQGLAVLSGGERSLTASALVFALLRVSPPPFCVLDEVDAMLDEANVGRFCDLLTELSESTQFIVITHNRQTVQVAEAVYGITMGADSASRSISLDLEEAAREVAA